LPHRAPADIVNEGEVKRASRANARRVLGLLVLGSAALPVARGLATGWASEHTSRMQVLLFVRERGPSGRVSSVVRAIADSDKVRRFMEALGRKCRGEGRVYFTGGATAVLIGWRSSTVDIDLKLSPEPAGAFEAIAAIKEELDVNVELAAPDQFVAPAPGWKERSLFIARHGAVDFYHYDPVGQVLAKVERGHTRDLADARAMMTRGMVQRAELETYFEHTRDELLRYPALDVAVFERKLAAFLAQFPGEPS
jgi:hypothetical protein